MNYIEDEKNYIGEIYNTEWYQWYPQESQKPEFQKVTINQMPCLIIESAGNDFAYGKWCFTAENITGGRTYKFRVEYQAREINNETVSVSSILTWQDQNNKDITRDYAELADRTDDGWSVLHRVIEAPDDARKVKFELVLRWPGKGSVIWRNPKLTETEPCPPRIIRAATTFINPWMNPDMTKEGCLRRICHVVDEAGKQNADIILLSETINDRGLPLPLAEKAETISGEYVRLMSEKARQYRCYIIFTFHEAAESLFYNTAILMDRNGEISGVYRKTHLALCEGEEGIVPGNEYPVFQTDFGKIGILICWDHYFPEPARIMRLKGAEILFVSTAGCAPIQSLARAIDNGMYVIISGVNRKKPFPDYPSRMINPLGEVFADVQEEDMGVCVSEINLNHRYYSYWLSVGDSFGENRAIYAKERRPDTYGDIISIQK